MPTHKRHRAEVRAWELPSLIRAGQPWSTPGARPPIKTPHPHCQAKRQAVPVRPPFPTSRADGPSTCYSTACARPVSRLRYLGRLAHFSVDAPHHPTCPPLRYLTVSVHGMLFATLIPGPPANSLLPPLSRQLCAQSDSPRLHLPLRPSLLRPREQRTPCGLALSTVTTHQSTRLPNSSVQGPVHVPPRPTKTLGQLRAAPAAAPCSSPGPAAPGCSPGASPGRRPAAPRAAPTAACLRVKGG